MTAIPSSACWESLQLRLVQDQHEQTRQFRCPHHQCGLQFKRHEALRVHLRTRHGELVRPVREPQPRSLPFSTSHLNLKI